MKKHGILISTHLQCTLEFSPRYKNNTANYWLVMCLTLCLFVPLFFLHQIVRCQNEIWNTNTALITMFQIQIPVGHTQ